MICKLEIYNGELNLFPVVTNERVFAQITMGNIVKGQPGKSPIIGENDNWWIWDDAEGKYVDSGKVATTSGDVVKYVEAKDEQHPNRKAIQLNNGDLITGVANKEGLGSVNIAMVNEWDVVDLGTSELPLNMNTPKGVRPTVQEAGQSGEEANKIAYLSDIPEDKEPDTFLISGHSFQELKEAIASKKVILIMDATNSYQVMNYSFSGRLDNATTIDGYYVSSIRTEYGRTYFSFVTLSDKGDGTIKIDRPTRDQIYIPEANIINGLTEEETGKVLDATQGKVLKEMIEQSGGLPYAVVFSNQLEAVTTNEGIKSCIKVEDFQKVLEAINNNGVVIYVSVTTGKKESTVLSTADITLDNSNPDNPKLTLVYNFPASEVIGSTNYLTVVDQVKSLTISPVQLPDGTTRHMVQSTNQSNGSLRFYTKGLPDKFLAGDGTYKEISLPSGGSDLEVIKLSWIFNESPSMYIYELWIFKEENDKLFKAIEDGKPIVFALYDGNQSSPYNKLTQVIGNILIDSFTSGDNFNVRTTQTFFDSYESKFKLINYVFGTFNKSNTSDRYQLELITNPTGSMGYSGYKEVDLDFSGSGQKFLSDDGTYKTIPTIQEVKAPRLIISTRKKLASSSVTELSDYIKPEVQSGQIPIELFLNCIYCLNVEAGQTPIYTKPYTVLSNTFEQVAVIKVMVPDIVNKKFNEVTINIDQATRAITVNESVTLSDM